METMTLEIRDRETVQAIEETAARQGVTAEACALELLGTALLAQKPFEEIAEPIARSFDQSGMTEDELDDLINQAKQAVRASRRKV